MFRNVLLNGDVEQRRDISISPFLHHMPQYKKFIILNPQLFSMSSDDGMLENIFIICICLILVLVPCAMIASAMPLPFPAERLLMGLATTTAVISGFVLYMLKF